MKSVIVTFKYTFLPAKKKPHKKGGAGKIFVKRGGLPKKGGAIQILIKRGGASPKGGKAAKKGGAGPPLRSVRRNLRSLAIFVDFW